MSDLEVKEVKRGRPAMNTVENPTKPGWKPAARMAGIQARSGFTARWVSDEPDNIARKKEEGWIIMKPDDNIKKFDSQDVNDASQTDSRIRYRGMIAMMLPNNLKEARTEYYKAETNRATQMIMRETDKEAKKMGVETYKPKGASGRIIIE
jgi:hypothetical protein